MNDEIKNKRLVTTCATGTGIFAACCFGVFGILGLLGFTTLLAYINTYGDYVFLPGFSAFGTVLVYALLQWRRNASTYAASAVTTGLMIFFSFFSIFSAGLILGGVVIGLLIVRNIRGERGESSCPVGEREGELHE